MKISVGICAFNEQDNIGKALSKLTKYPFEVIVIASGCTDNTVSIAKNYNCKVIVQEKREGKASAVNVFLQENKSDICILHGADIIPSDFCFKYLLKEFDIDNVGMVGAHPIPINSLSNYINKVGHLLWNTHHSMALKYPKAGEVCAFRNIVKGIDKRTAVDEASIEQQIVDQGYKVVYAEDAIVFNKAPETINDFIKQRKRIYLGHMKLKDSGYSVSTMNLFNVLKATLKNTKGLDLLVYSAYLEYKSRKLAVLDYKNNKDNAIWDRVDSTKDLR